MGNVKAENRVIREAAEENLKTKYRRRKGTERGKEQPWMNEEIRRGIKERRKLNKIHRNCRNEQDREDAWKNYSEQKEIVKRLIAEEIRIFELRVT